LPDDEDGPDLHSWVPNFLKLSLQIETTPVADNPEMILVSDKELEKFAQGLPPNFKTEYLKSPDEREYDMIDIFDWPGIRI